MAARWREDPLEAASRTYVSLENNARPDLPMTERLVTNVLVLETKPDSGETSKMDQREGEIVPCMPWCLTRHVEISE